MKAKRAKSKCQILPSILAVPALPTPRLSSFVAVTPQHAVIDLTLDSNEEEIRIPGQPVKFTLFSSLSININIVSLASNTPDFSAGHIPGTEGILLSSHLLILLMFVKFFSYGRRVEYGVPRSVPSLQMIISKVASSCSPFCCLLR